jgi:transcription-repair coupling factor (superfamily II helicase)
MRVLGIGLYQELLASAVARLRNQPSAGRPRATLSLGAIGTIPNDYVSDAAIRLSLHAKLLRASSVNDVDALEEEFDDRFGQPPEEVRLLLRTIRLQLAAGRVGFAKLEGGPKAMAITLSPEMPAKRAAELTKKCGAIHRDGRLIFEISRNAGIEQLEFFERITALVSR